MESERPYRVEKLREFYDFIIIDCMPSLGMITINALACADSVLIPVQAAYLPVKGLQQLIKTIGRVKKQLNPKLKIEAMKRSAGRPTKENACQSGTHLRSDQELASQVGESARSIQRYIRLTYLVPELLEMIDLKKLQFVMAVDISYFDEQIQNWICEYIKDNGFIKPVQISALKNYPNLSKANQFSVISIMNDALPKKSSSAKVSLSEKKLDKYFPSHFTAKERENVIIQLLEQWSAEQKQTE